MAPRLLMADTVRFKFQTIKALSMFESSKVKSETVTAARRDRFKLG